MNKELKIVISAEDRASAEINSFGKSVNQVENKILSLNKVSSTLKGTIANVGDSFMEASRKASTLAQIGIAGLTTAIVGLGTKGVMMAGDLQQIRLGLQTLTGSAEEADKAMKQIKIDAMKTPFDLREIARANQMLISTGLSTDASREAVLALGNAIVATGGGQAEFSRMIGNLQQIKNVGEASAMDIRQFGFAGINIYKLMEEAGKKAGRTLTNSYEDIVYALKVAQEEGGLFENALQKQGNSFNLVISNLKDIANVLLADIVEGTGVFGFINNKLIELSKYLTENKDAFVNFFKGLKDNPKLIEFVEKVNTNFKKFSDWVKQNGELVKNFLIGLAVAFTLLTIVGTITGLLNPFNLILLTIATTIAFVKTIWEQNLYGIRDITFEVLNKVKTFFEENKTAIIFILETLKFAIQIIWETIKQIVITAVRIIYTTIEFVFNQIKDTITAILGIIEGVMKVFFGIFTGDWGLAMEGARQIVDVGFNLIKDTFGNVADFIINIMKSLFEGVISWFTAIIDYALGWAEKIKEIISNAFSGGKSVSIKNLNPKEAFDKAIQSQSIKDFYSNPQPLTPLNKQSSQYNTNNSNVLINFNGNMSVRNDNDINKISNEVKNLFNRENLLYRQGLL